MNSESKLRSVGIIGDSPVMQLLARQIETAASCDFAFIMPPCYRLVATDSIKAAVRELDMTTDLSTRHELVGDLISLPKNSAEWDRYKLTAEQVAFYHEQGYLAGVPILTDDQIAQLQAELIEFFGVQTAVNNRFLCCMGSNV